MLLKSPKGEKLVICEPVRTPIGQAGKSLSSFESYELGTMALEEIFKRSGVDKKHVDGIVAGEIGQSSRAPNVARVMAVKANLPLESTAVTVANNCVSGYEAVVDGARRLITGEGELYAVVGLESMSRFGFYLKGTDQAKFSSVDKLKKNWNEALEGGVDIVDSVEEGLTDPIRHLNMAMTGEVAAQNYALKKADLDEYAYESYRKAYEAIKAGKYRSYQMSVKHDDGVLEDDEYIMSKTGMVENKDRFARASVIFDSKWMSLKEFYDKYKDWIKVPYQEGKSEAAVTLFNACPRSDGSGALFVATEGKARALGLNPVAAIKSWGMYGVDPAYMGIGMAFAMNKAREVAGMEWKDIEGYEIHEAFAATALGSMREVKKSYGFDLEEANKAGKVNPHGGTLALGHPLGATGIRVIINQLMHMKEKGISNCLGTICAGGGVGGAILLEAI